MFFLKFLLNAVDEHDHVARSFVEHIVPSLMERYAVTSAKGGDHEHDTYLNEDIKRKFEAKSDQNMVSHQLNGLFPTLSLINRLEAEGVMLTPFSEIERRVYILAYLMHDVDKIVQQETGLKGVKTQDREAIELAKHVIAQQLQFCNVEAFFPDYTTYLEDITYLVVNTQQMWGTHLHTHLWRFQLRERRLLILRRLCTYSDHIAYLVSSPSTILSEKETRTLTTILSELSDDSLIFTYHQLREVRGLFTNVINDSMVNLFLNGHEGIWPYLFFSNGVVYIQRKSLQFTISIEQIVEKVHTQLRQMCAERIKNSAPGFKFSIQGIAKHPGYYFEFLTLEEYAELLADYTIKRTTNDVTAIPLAKIRQMQINGEIPANIRTDILSPDKRIGIMSRFLSVVFTTLLDLFDKKQTALRERVEREVVEHLGLTPYWSQAQAIPNKGGVEYRWFWLAACYKHEHTGIDSYDDENSLLQVFRSTLTRIIMLAGDELRQHMPQRYLNHLTRYLDSVVELPIAVRKEGILPDFQGEMARYIGAKSKGRKLICTLCNSAYPTEEQSDNAVLFQPWVYKNKLSLYAGKNAGGICAICALELMLRQILQQGLLRLTGSKFEALKTKYLTIYPNFFFTKETGALMEGVLAQLQAINFFSIRRQLNGQEITLKSLFELEIFSVSDNEQLPPPVLSLHEEEESEEEEEGEEIESPASHSVERSSYIKFQQTSYPGMYLFGTRAMKDDDDTSSWAMPAFLALALPLVTNAKVVLSELPLPLFSSGHDFHETVVIDAPHAYLTRLLQGNRIRVNNLLVKLSLLTNIYRVNLDTYAKQGKPEWKHLSNITRDLVTDPLFLFSYLRKQQRDEKRDALRSDRIESYINIYKSLLQDTSSKEKDLSKIEQCVDRYTQFYRGGFESHSILKPVDIVARAIISSPLNIDADDLLWQIQGELKNWLDRVRNRQAAGRALFWGKDIDAKELPALKAFVQFFYQEVFLGYCEGERGILRSRLNRFKDGCEAYYVYQRSIQRIQEQAEQQSEMVEETVEI